MPKILHTARYTGTPWEILKSVVPEGFTVETLEELSYECLLRQAVDADYLLVSGRLPIDEGVLSVAKHLKMIQRTWVQRCWIWKPLNAMEFLCMLMQA